MTDEIEHTCQFCYYEYFDGRAYPCSMCVCGEERKDMFQPKGRQNKRKTENCSEKPNICEHITEDGVTCAKYPACDDCLDNPLNKVKGSERLLKGKTEPTISKMEQVDEPKTQAETQNSNLTFEKRTMRDCYNCKRYEAEGECIECHYEPKDEPQTDCAWK